MIRALFFDAAGTLIEPAEPVASAYTRVAEAEGIRVDPGLLGTAFRQVFSSLGDPAWPDHPDGDAAERAWWKEVVGRTLEQAASHPIPKEEMDACFTALFSHYTHPSAWRVFPEVRDVLDAARQKGWKLGVVSNFDRRLHGVLAGLGLEFDAVVTSSDSACRKPGEAIFRDALRLSGCRPEEVVHTGDSPEADIKGATAVGIRSFLIDRPRTDLRDFIHWVEFARK